MAAVVGLDPDHLIFMVEVQWSFGVRFNGEVEHRRACLEQVEQGLVVHAVVCCNEVCTAETILSGAASWDEDGGVVDGDGDNLLVRENKGAVPEGSRML